MVEIIPVLFKLPALLHNDVKRAGAAAILDALQWGRRLKRVAMCGRYFDESS
jgi:hypothetical protein